MAQRAITFANVNDLSLVQRLTDVEGQQVRRHLEQHAEPAAVRHYFRDADALRNVAQVLDKAVDGGVLVSSVVDAIDRGAHKQAIANELCER